MKAAPHAGAKTPGILAVILVLAFGASARAEVTVSPSAVDFAGQAVGTTSAPVSVKLTNTGKRKVRFSGASISEPVFLYAGPSRSFTLQPQQSLTVSVSFRPDAAQPFAGYLTFTQSRRGGAIAVALSGTGTNTNITPTSQPLITSQPASRTVLAGQTASFSVSVTGTAPFTYQWQKNGSAIRGATSSSYTTSATTTADSGSQFTVVVSNSAGSVTSKAAELTVTAATLTLSVDPGSLSFGDIDLGSSASRQFALGNSGNGNVTLSGISVTGAGFGASGVFSGQILKPGQTVAVNVSFQPAVAGTVTGAVTISSDAAPLSVALSGSGVQQVSHAVWLSWTPSTSTATVSGYLVYSSQVSGGPYAKVTNTALTLSSYTDSSVRSGQTYYYVVTAVDSSGVQSTYSEEARAVVP